MRHSCRCRLHPVLSLLAVGAVGSVIGFGVYLWLEPLTSALVVTAGAIVGVTISWLFGESLIYGLGVGACVMALAVGVRALATIWTTLQNPPSHTSARAWFSR